LYIIIKFAFGGDFVSNWMFNNWIFITGLLREYVLISILFGRWSDYFPLPIVRKFLKSSKEIRSKVQETIDKRKKEETSETNDLLSAMLKVSDGETGRRFSDEQIIDETLTFLFSGQDTTANMLAWCMFFLGQDKSIQKKLQNEVDTILGNDDPTAESIPKLKYW